MATITVNKFSGLVPILDDTKLPDGAASFAENCYLYSGALQGIHTFEDLHTMSPGNVYAYRIPLNGSSPHNMAGAQSKWVEFQAKYVDVIPSAVVNDTYSRYYFAQENSAPTYNTLDRLLANSPAFLLGVPAPGYTPTVSVSGGSGAVNNITRSYVVTCLSAYSEEGPPSPPRVVTGFSNGTWQIGITAFTDAQRNITKQRIYRTITSSQGVATYFFVAEVTNTNQTYNDTFADTKIVANNQLISTTWFPPPTDLKGWVSMPNGIIAGWRGKEVWFCEPYRPHAWPSEYALSTDYTIVGLGVYGQSLVVCTKGYPAAVTGINPASMSMAKVLTFEPCLSRGSIVSAPEGVYYISPNGLILASQGQFTNITKDFISRDKWQDLVQIDTAKATRTANAYLSFGSSSPGVFETTAFNTSAFEQNDYTGAFAGFFLDPMNPNVATTINPQDGNLIAVDNAITDPWNGETYLVMGGKVKWFDFHSNQKPRKPYTWRSKRYQGAFKQNFEAAKVFFTVPPAITFNPLEFPRNNNLVQTISPTQYGLLRVYADDVLVATREIRTSGEQLRLPSGFKSEFWQFEVEAVVNVSAVHLATSAKELRNV